MSADAEFEEFCFQMITHAGEKGGGMHLETKATHLY
jgi:hypothetical protein